jgi:hypothetical protein
MITITGFPKNKGKYTRPAIFAREILDICKDLNITPVLDGTLAVFAYTRNPDIDVNDIDLSCPEAEFPKIINAWRREG